MKFFLALVFSGAFGMSLYAQNAQPSAPASQPFGKIDKSDLEMTACDFEQDANAEILFDKGSVYFGAHYERIFERHVRIKIFNENGKNESDIKLRYIGDNNYESISDVKAETFNLNNGAVEITKVDSKQIFEQRINKLVSETVFSFPAVKPGCVIEYQYTLTSRSVAMPNWSFQTNIPTRYSEINTTIPGYLTFKSLVVVNQPLVKNTEDVKALANIPSLPEELYMGARKDNVERVVYQLTNIGIGTLSKSFADTWEKIGKDLTGYDYFGGQLKRKLTGEDDIVNKAKGLSSDPQKIAFIFNEVKTQMKWDGETTWYTNAGTAEAWDKKKGNSAEINLILYHLLKKSGVNAFPMLVSTRTNGKVYPAYPNLNQFNKTVAFVPVDSSNYYVLDASNKYYTYNDIPRNLLDGFGFCINGADDKYDLVFLQKTTPVLQAVSITADITPDGKMNGSAVISSYSYHRINAVERYNAEGEKKYISYLRDKDKNLKITALKLDDMDADTLPLKQNIDFSLDPAVPDDNYIYFSPNLFSRLKNNPFLSEKRLTDIDFEFRNSYLIAGVFKIPAGFKADVLPKNTSMTMPDKSIIFKRLVAEQDGSIVTRYVLEFKKSLYFKEDYPEIHEFYKKLYEMLNEQIVLKKS